MSTVQNPSKERLDTAWLGARAAVQVPVFAGAGAGVKSRSREGGVPATTSRRWPRVLLRYVRDIAIGLTLITAVPLVAIMRAGKSPVSYLTPSMQLRLSDAERWRPLMAPQDASITPMQAGEALRSLITVRENDKFPMRGTSLRAERVWQTRKLGPEMFSQIRNPNTTLPAPTALIEMSSGPLSALEMAYLRDVAESPVWEAFDQVAQAPGVDIIGGRFELPFVDDAWVPSMPALGFADTKALAHAGISRAAYYVASGQPARAEAALRSIVSFGFALLDNGANSYDALVGRVIADIGRDGLRQFYMVTGNGNMMALTERVGNTNATDANNARVMIPLAERQARLLADARNPALPRALRFESLRSLSFATCGSVKGVLQGPSDDVRAAFEDASRTLARYPSERAYLELLMEMPGRMPPNVGERRGLSPWALAGAATSAVAGVVLQNPRIEACSRVAGMWN